MPGLGFFARVRCTLHMKLARARYTGHAGHLSLFGDTSPYKVSLLLIRSVSRHQLRTIWLGSILLGSMRNRISCEYSVSGLEPTATAFREPRGRASSHGFHDGAVAIILFEFIPARNMLEGGTRRARGVLHPVLAWSPKLSSHVMINVIVEVMVQVGSFPASAHCRRVASVISVPQSTFFSSR